jgi:hypothetical protein
MKREERVKEEGKLENDAPEYANHRSVPIIRRRARYRIALSGTLRAKDRPQKVNSQTRS